MPKAPNHPTPPYSPPLSPMYSSSYASSVGSSRNSPSTPMIVAPNVQARQGQSNPAATRRESVELQLQDARAHFDSKFEEFLEETQEAHDHFQLLEDEQQEDKIIFQRQLGHLQEELINAVLSLDSRVQQVEKMSSEGQMMLARNGNDLKGVRMTADMIKDIKIQLDSGKSIKDVLQIINSKVPAGTLQPAKVCTRQQSSALGAKRHNPPPTVAQKGRKKPPARRVICEFCKKNLSINSIIKHKKLYCPVLKRIRQGK